jgi:hypothetical protein
MLMICSLHSFQCIHQARRSLPLCSAYPFRFHIHISHTPFATEKEGSEGGEGGKRTEGRRPEQEGKEGKEREVKRERMEEGGNVGLKLWDPFLL